MIRFDILGPLELRDTAGRALRSVLAQPKRTALLAYLAAAGGGAARRRDSIVGVLWPESPQDRARHSLNQAVHALRRSLGARVLVSVGDEQLGIDPLQLRCDVQAFDRAIDAGEFEPALELYRGPLLDGFFLADSPQFTDWLEQERARLRERALFGAWSLADAAEQGDNPAGAAAWARRAAAVAPDDEGGLRRLLTMLSRLGDRAGALAAYDAFARRLAAEHEAAPAEETVELAERIRGLPRAAPPPLPVAAHPSAADPPAPATALIGRHAERARLAELLLHTPECRLVTITGPGGIGKTRLAQEAATELAPAFEDGMHVVMLAGVEAASLVPGAIAHTLGLPPLAPDAWAQVALALAQRNVLLVLDNFEQLADAAPFIAALLERTHLPKLLITSRQPLNVRAEWVVPITGLPVPAEDAHDLEGSDAAQLFLAAARRASGRTTPDVFGAESVAAICRLVEGVPLALELAAAWTRVLTCDEIRTEIARSRRFLGGSLRDVPERHRSLWAAFEHSWLRLDAEERDVFREICVFRGGFTREAAAAVVGARLDLLPGLVEKSLLRRSDDGRFELLESLREFGGEKLREADDRGAGPERRHARHYAELLSSFDDALSTAVKDDALRAISREIDNVRAAWSAAVRHRTLDALAAAASPWFAFLDCRGWYAEAESAFGDAAAALESAPDPGWLRVRAAVLARQGAACWRLGEAARAQQLLERALEDARASHDAREAAFALDRLAMLAYEAGAHSDGERLVRDSLAFRREVGDTRGIATSLNNLGSMAYAVGDYASAKRFCEDGLALQRRIGDEAGTVISLQNLGYIELVLGDGAAAESRLEEALAAAELTGSALLVARARVNLGNLANVAGDASSARVHFEIALRRALEAQADALALEAVLGAGVSLQQEGDRSRALALVTLVAHHGATDGGVRARAEAIARELTLALAAGAAKAVARGRALRLEQAVQEIAAGTTSRTATVSDRLLQ